MAQLPPSERRNPRSAEIDRLGTSEILALINAEDGLIAQAVATELPAIARVVDAVVAAFGAGGRLIYLGAGTSGRLGVLDASECGPTFSAPEGMVVGLIAGGEPALRHPVEGAEDSVDQGAADLAALTPGPNDVILGIAVSGTTPYVLGALAEAQRAGATTAALTCNPVSPVASAAQISIAPVLGAEVITGSTRMKSGTAQKMVLNMITTAAMIRIGKTYGNLMVDLRVSNIKLAGRAQRILVEITGIAPETAPAALEAAGGDLKTAIMMQMTGITADEARARLAAAGGVLRQALEPQA